MAKHMDNQSNSAENSSHLRLIGTDGVQETERGSWWQPGNRPRPSKSKVWELRLNIGTKSTFWNAKEDVRFDGAGRLLVRDTTKSEADAWVYWNPPCDHGINLIDPWGSVWAYNNWKWNCIQESPCQSVVWKRAAGGSGWGC